MKKRNAEGLLIDEEGKTLPADQQQTLEEEKAEIAAKGKNSQDDSDDDGDGAEDFTDPEKAKAEIKKLRSEAAKHRTKAKTFETELATVKGTLASLKKAITGEDDSEDPVKKASELASKNEALEMELSINELAYEHEIPKDQKKYFKFLLAEKMESLKEGEEMSDEDITEVAAQVKKLSGGGGSKNSTGLNSGGKNPDQGGSGGLTVEKFVKMNTGEKSDLYSKNPAEYQRLFDAAKEKGLLK